VEKNQRAAETNRLLLRHKMPR